MFSAIHYAINIYIWCERRGAFFPNWILTRHEEKEAKTTYIRLNTWFDTQFIFLSCSFFLCVCVSFFPSFVSFLMILPRAWDVCTYIFCTLATHIEHTALKLTVKRRFSRRATIKKTRKLDPMGYLWWIRTGYVDLCDSQHQQQQHRPEEEGFLTIRNHEKDIKSEVMWVCAAAAAASCAIVFVPILLVSLLFLALAFWLARSVCVRFFVVFTFIHP